MLEGQTRTMGLQRHTAVYLSSSDGADSTFGCLRTPSTLYTQMTSISRQDFEAHVDPSVGAVPLVNRGPADRIACTTQGVRC